MITATATAIIEKACGASTRVEVIASILEALDAQRIAEVGVWKGELAAALLKRSAHIETYYMVDPWRNLEQWHKPYNVPDAEFTAIYAQALANTEFASSRRRVLRGTSLETANEVADGSLDAIYIDGDHTLRGIAIDLNVWWPKLRQGGILIGDDFVPKLWQHGQDFEPTMVFPYAIFFAEYMGQPITALPHRQFAIVKDQNSVFSFNDPSGRHTKLLRDGWWKA